jgi:hypothetical protein
MSSFNLASFIFVFDIAKKYVVETSNQIYIQDAIFERHEKEINRLRRRPHNPICQINQERFVLQEISSFAC